jgi:hypothetical protein
MPPGAPFVKGRENIKQLWDSAIQQMGLKEVHTNTLDLEVMATLRARSARRS